MQLEYAGPAQLSLSAEDLPDHGWPRPRAPRWPFSGELSDYLRVGAASLHLEDGCSGDQLELAPMSASCVTDESF
jgi:hypothetical protein